MVRAWYFAQKNFGDVLNKDLIETLSKDKVECIRGQTDVSGPVYACCGSIIQYLDVPCTIWGAGFIAEDSNLKTIPSSVRAVRGPRTRDKLLSLNVQCPEVYGDPGLLMPRIYDLKPDPRYELGIIPHYMDKTNEFLPKEGNGIKIINVFGGPRSIVETMLRCKKIISSSLHGLIVAEAYGLPTLWVRFSDLIIGGNFKFLDYYESIEADVTEPIYIKSPTSWLELSKQCTIKPLKINLRKLLETCPFYKK